MVLYYKNPEIGCIKGFKHSIRLKSENVSISARPYPVPFKLYQETKAEISRLENLGIIKKSKSLYASPCFPIPKKTGGIRIVTDYRKLNNNTLKENFPLPEIVDILHSLNGSNIFTTLDLNQGFFQIQLEKESCAKTSFVLPWGQYKYTVMPFGLSNAPRTFQRAMNLILEEVSFAKVYMDDILIHSANQEDHLKHVEYVLKKLNENGISINYSKCKFSVPDISYLGYNISKDGVKCQSEKILEKINVDKIKTKKNIMQVTGILNWFRPFIPRLSKELHS